MKMESPDMTKVLIETSDPFILRALADLLEGNTPAAPVAGLTEDTCAVPTTPSAAPAGMTPPAPAPATPTTAAEPAADVDVDGMPWDGEIHASTKTKTQDGKWKSRQGKADEAKAAREAFLSAGGNVTPPTDLPANPGAESVAAPAPQADPVAAAPVATAGEVVQMPGIPGAAPAPQVTPIEVTYEKLGEKLMGMIRRGTLDQQNQYPELLKKCEIPLTDPNTPLQNDAGLRSRFYASLCEIEPDMA